MTLKNLIESCNFDYVNPNIEENFKYEEPTGKVELLKLTEDITSEEAIKEMANRGLRPATLTELLIFAKESNEAFSPDYYIVALGSVAKVDGDRCVLYLDDWDVGRELLLDWFENGWDGRCRFAAVRLVSSSLDTSRIQSHLETIKSSIKAIEELL